jgi:hypothetical protein
MAGLDFDELYEVATAPLLSDTIRSKMRKVQQDIGPIKVKMSSKA